MTMRKVLVTGAGGFVGGWVVESFLLSGIPVRAGVRRWNSAVRLARHPADVVLCDVLAPQQLDQALEGCDSLVHCALGPPAVSTAGMRHVLDAAQRHRLRRVVHVSSVAVYGRSAGVIDEAHPLRSRGNRYAAGKIAAERLVEQYVKRGLPVTVLRPSIIYGPFGAAWTVSFARRLLSGQWGTMGSYAEGWCNLVYVTDVVQAVYRALQSDESVGEAFQVNGPEVVTWNEYFCRFNAALGGQPLRAISPRRLAWKAQLLAPVRAGARAALARLEPALYRLRAQSPSAAHFMRSTESLLRVTPTAAQMKLYGVAAQYTIDKARYVLGYCPGVGLDQGLDDCARWLHQQGIVDAQEGR